MADKVEVTVQSRSGKALGVYQLSLTATVADLKSAIHSQSSFHSDPRLHPSRQWLTLNGAPLKDDYQSMKSIGLKVNIVVKDLGAQMSWRGVYIVEYFGPIFIFPLLYFCPQLCYSGTPTPHTFTQQYFPRRLAFVMLMFHFLKRELETIFVHRFSNATMPVTRLPINCGHYWGLNGLLIGYFLFHPLYQEPLRPPYLAEVLIFIFFISELLNMKTHLILRDLRPEGTKKRGIPEGAGFGWVSCANYFWEIVAWTAFAVFSQCLTSYIFLLMSFVTLVDWSKTRHRRYIKEFDGKDGRPLYPRNRKALLPFLL